MAKKDKIQHLLVPEHIKVSDAEKKRLFDEYALRFKDIPKMNLTDPAIKHLDVQEGDIVKIIRNSPSAGHSIFYRGVIDE